MAYKGSSSLKGAFSIVNPLLMTQQYISKLNNLDKFRIVLDLFHRTFGRKLIGDSLQPFGQQKIPKTRNVGWKKMVSIGSLKGKASYT
jgi:hypothetical protein